MLEEILELQRSLNLSQGELLDIAQKVIVDDSIRTIDRLTEFERSAVISILLKIRDYELAGVC